jgi:cytochrome c553
MKTLAAFLLLALLAIAFDALAQAPDVSSCAGCHGAKGEGNAVMGAPRIAAQPAEYLARQLEAYANARRRNEVMEPIAKGLSADQRRVMAAHYATLDGGASSSARGTAPERARRLANVGDEKLQVQACVNCHGPDGIGEPPRNPYLAGQVSRYLEASMAEWRSGARDTDPARQMPLIAARLPDADVRALAAYFATLPPPGPQLLEGRAPRVVGGTPAATSPASETSKGVGVEQGAPTTGGAQGPGGGGATTGGAAQGNPTTPKR